MPSCAPGAATVALPAISRRKAAARLVRGERPSSHVVVIANPLRLVQRRLRATVSDARAKVSSGAGNKFTAWGKHGFRAATSRHVPATRDDQAAFATRPRLAR